MVVIDHGGGARREDGDERFAARFGPYVGALFGVFALLFVGLQLWPLAAVFLACFVFVGSAVFWTLRHPERRNPLVVWIWFFVFAQALLAVWMLGTAAGFQFYLLATIPPSFSLASRSFLPKLLKGALVVFFFLACDIWLNDLSPLYPHSPQFLAALRHVNTVGSCAMLAGSAYIQGTLVNDSVVALRRAASADPLTGLFNRRAFTEIVEREVARSQRTGEPLSLALGDIDFFKRVNDQHGHAAGDRVLQSVANSLRRALRDYDGIARWGGEEFIMLLPASGAAPAMAIVERLRELVAARQVDFEGSAIAVTMSFGVAQRTLGEDWHAVVARADEALYRAKSGGRNRVEQG